MGRSQILKDLANGNDIESVLFRLKIILADLENESINKWIDNEIEGYDDTDETPPYRRIEGRAIGSYILGSTYHGIKYTKHPLPIRHIPKDIREKILGGRMTQAVSSLKKTAENEESIGIQLPPELCQKISYQGLFITSMNIVFSSAQIDGVLAKIKSKLINIIMKLEKDYNELDSLDIFSHETDESKREQTEKYIINILFDNSIEIGNDNEINSTTIGHNGINNPESKLLGRNEG